MSESDAGSDDRTQRPILDESIGRFSERLKEAIGDQSVRGFARAAGLSETVLRSYARGDTLPTIDRLAQIAAASGRSIAWLMGDEESSGHVDEQAAADVLLEAGGDTEAAARVEARTKKAAAAIASGNDPMLSAEDYAFVPYMSVRVAAGDGQVVESEQIVAWMAFRRSYLQTLGVPSKAACLVRVKGDSMDPDLRDGDTVLLDTSDTRVTDKPHAFAYRVDGTDEIAVKRIRRVGDQLEVTGGDHWPTRTFDQEPTILGRVRWSGRTWD